MSVTNVACVLRRAGDFEHQLMTFYLDLAEQSTREGVRLLTDYMARHRRRLAESLERFPAAEYQRISALPLRYEPVSSDCDHFRDRLLSPDATASDVLDLAIELDECLISLYRQVAQQDVEPEVKDLFESLVHAEERDEILLKKIRATNYF
jgi:rubrerythrin